MRNKIGLRKYIEFNKKARSHKYQDIQGYVSAGYSFIPSEGDDCFILSFRDNRNEYRIEFSKEQAEKIMEMWKEHMSKIKMGQVRQ